LWRPILYVCGGGLAIARALLAYLGDGDRPLYPELLAGGLLCCLWAAGQVRQVRRERRADAVRASVTAFDEAPPAPRRGRRWTGWLVDLVVVLLFAGFVWPTPWAMGSEMHPSDGRVLHYRTPRWGGMTHLWIDGEWSSPID